MLGDPCVLMESRSRTERPQTVVLMRFLYQLPEVTGLTHIPGSRLSSVLLTNGAARRQQGLSPGSRSVLGPQAAPGQGAEGRCLLPWVGSDLWRVLPALLGCLTAAGSWWAVS